MEDKHNHSGISNGFIIGFLLGIVVTLLFTTKRGRDIIRMLTEKGVEKIDSWKDVLDATEEEFLDDEEPSVEESMVREPSSVKSADVSERKVEKTSASSQEKKTVPTKTSLRRFFRKPSTK